MNKLKIKKVEKTSEVLLKIDGRKFNKPLSAGNSGFRKHNRKFFIKTERLRELNKKD